MNYLASPPLVVAYALAGSMDVDLVRDPLGTDTDGDPVYLRDIWPSPQEVQESSTPRHAEMFATDYADVFAGDERWRNLVHTRPAGHVRWVPSRTYVRKPPYFDVALGGPKPAPVTDIEGAAGAGKGCVIRDPPTTISPAGLRSSRLPRRPVPDRHGVERKDFNSYGSRRQPRVMIRGTFANIRLRKPARAGCGGRVHPQPPDPEHRSRFTMRAGVPGGGPAPRDPRGQGIRQRIVARLGRPRATALLGVRAVIAESYERIHRSNLIGMGVLPLQFPPGRPPTRSG
jgi:aconitate hydratase